MNSNNQDLFSFVLTDLFISIGFFLGHCRVYSCMFLCLRLQEVLKDQSSDVPCTQLYEVTVEPIDRDGEIVQYRKVDLIPSITIRFISNLENVVIHLYIFDISESTK